MCVKECRKIPSHVINLHSCKFGYCDATPLVQTVCEILVLDITADVEWRMSFTGVDCHLASSRCCNSNVLSEDCVFFFLSLLTFVCC
jgi:hypothetical protein